MDTSEQALNLFVASQGSTLRAGENASYISWIKAHYSVGNPVSSPHLL
jgi:hypothetical protein